MSLTPCICSFPPELYTIYIRDVYTSSPGTLTGVVYLGGKQAVSLTVVNALVIFCVHRGYLQFGHCILCVYVSLDCSASTELYILR